VEAQRLQSFFFLVTIDGHEKKLIKKKKNILENYKKKLQEL
jgi:hypothetical protein